MDLAVRSAPAGCESLGFALMMSARNFALGGSDKQSPPPPLPRVLQAVRQFRLRVPDDVSLVGFDDVPVANWAAPALTTVRQPLAAMAATAFRMLRAGDGAAAAESHHVELATTLIVRDSTAPPPRPAL